MSSTEARPRLSLALFAGYVAAAATLAACNNHTIKSVMLEKNSVEVVDLELVVNKDVDILFVIDNSGSMGEEQAILANNFGAFIEVLEAEDVRANYRIGVTTSDNDNPWCDGTSPEGGRLVLSSCVERIDDFVFNGTVPIDVKDIACNDICGLAEAELAITPTATDVDTNEVARPWLENIEGVKNIPESTSMIEAFRCFGPQGINGCGFESQLESMYLSLVRASDPGEAEYGFIRDHAILAVVFVTDEADCSLNKNWSEIFTKDGSQEFWADPDSLQPTSGLCWRAGVECSGDPSDYACEPSNKDVDGLIGASDVDAVLHPMSRYQGLLDDLEHAKQKDNGNQELIVALIGGVDSDGQVHYADATNDDGAFSVEFQGNFGIGPGCLVDPNDPDDPDARIAAVPPVRLRELVEGYSEGNMFSICEDDYSAALEAIAQEIRDQIQPACYKKCVKDIDASSPQVEPECSVSAQPPGDVDRVWIQECARGDDGDYVIDLDTNTYQMPAPDVNACYSTLTDDPDAPSTPAAIDDMSEYCADRSYNLEFVITRRPGYPAAGGTTVTATCLLADFPQLSCPGIES